MSQELLVERLFEALISGDRPTSRAVVQETITQGVPAATVLTNLFWPAHEMIEKLHRDDQMTTISYQLSTRLLRTLVDQTSGRLQLSQAPTRTVFAACGPSQGEELAAQMAVDLLETGGFEVAFTGGGIPADEILEQVQQRQPDVLLLFASAAADLPGIRSIIDTLREIGACKKTQIVVGGGVFNRAEGLADEIGADLCVESPLDLVEMLTGQTPAPRLQTPAIEAARTAAAAKKRTKTRAAA